METNPTCIHEDAGSIPGPAQWVKRSYVAVSCGVGCRRGLDLALLWLWCRPAAIALIKLLAWELPHAPGVALKMKKRKKKKKKKKEPGPAGTGTPDIYATLFTALDQGSSQKLMLQREKAVHVKLHHIAGLRFSDASLLTLLL